MIKPQLQEISHKTSRSIYIDIFKEPHFGAYWHFHPEFELTYIVKGYGKRYVGDHIEDFHEGDLVLVGSNLPHCWISDEKIINSKKLFAEAYVIQFRKDIIVESALDMPEMINIHKVFDKSSQGIIVKGKTEKDVVIKIKELYREKGLKRYILLLEILELIGKSKSIKYLSNQSYNSSIPNTGNEAIQKIYDYVNRNYKKKFTLNELANLVHMNPSSLSRYFTKYTKQNLFTFINEIRISKVCRLLLNKNLTIYQTAFECGFSNLSNFNRQFKKVMKMSPVEYVEKYTSIG